MAFSKKTWVNRQTQYPTRRKLTAITGEDNVYDVTREEGNVTAGGDAFSAENMNDLEGRIEDGFNEQDAKPTIYSGVTEPTTTLGKDGDIYIQYNQ